MRIKEFFSVINVKPKNILEMFFFFAFEALCFYIKSAYGFTRTPSEPYKILFLLNLMVEISA